MKKKLLSLILVVLFAASFSTAAFAYNRVDMRLADMNLSDMELGDVIELGTLEDGTSVTVELVESGERRVNKVQRSYTNSYYTFMYRHDGEKAYSVTFDCLWFDSGMNSAIYSVTQSYEVYMSFYTLSWRTDKFTYNAAGHDRYLYVERPIAGGFLSWYRIDLQVVSGNASIVFREVF